MTGSSPTGSFEGEARAWPGDRVPAFRSPGARLARRIGSLWRLAHSHLVNRRLKVVNARYGLALQPSQPLAAHPEFRKVYRVRQTPRRWGGELAALHIEEPTGRFGNNLKQLIHAVFLAERLGIGRVYVAPLGLFRVERPMEAGGVAVRPGLAWASERPGPTLSGSFFYGRPFRRWLDGLPPESVAAIADRVGRPLLEQRALPSPPVLPAATDLVIHIRSGDVFGKRPNRRYPQPPLAYYRLCVRRAFAELGLRRVVLVYEDALNPCIGALALWLEQAGIPFATQSRPFEEDLALLLAARHCVFGRGSLGPAVTLLSRRLETVFSPWLEWALAPAAAARGLRHLQVEDRAGCFTPVGAWRNTEPQRRLILDYPDTSLAFADREA